MAIKEQARYALVVRGWDHATSDGYQAEGTGLDLLARLPEWHQAAKVLLEGPTDGELREGSPGAIALVLLQETDLAAPLEDYCSECPHCEPPVSVALDVGPDGLQVVPAEPCEWCGYDFGTVLFGPDRHECRDEEHLAHGVGCNNCGACLHASHGRN
jgi:hypothetical protein